MIPKYLPIIALLLLAGNANAKTGNSGSTTSSIGALRKSFAAAQPPGYRGDHAMVHFYYAIPDLGYSRLKIKDATNTNMSGGGFRWGGGIGVNIELGEGRNNMLSVGAHLHAETIKLKYKNAAGEDKTDKLKLSVATVPVSYTRLFYLSDDDAALFVQATAAAGMVTSASLNEKPVTDHMNGFFIEPMISIGATNLLHIVYRKSGRDVFQGRAFFAPYFGYIIGNMSTVAGTTMNGFDVGVKYIYSAW